MKRIFLTLVMVFSLISCEQLEATFNQKEQNE